MYDPWNLFNVQYVPCAYGPLEYIDHSTMSHLSFADGFPAVPSLPTGGAFEEAVERAHTHTSREGGVKKINRTQKPRPSKLL